MVKLTIESNDIKTLLTHPNTRGAAINIIENMKLSKYSYTGAEAKEGIYYYVELQDKLVDRLCKLIFDGEEKDIYNILNNLNVAFVIQLLKKKNRIEGVE